METEHGNINQPTAPSVQNGVYVGYDMPVEQGLMQNAYGAPTGQMQPQSRDYATYPRQFISYRWYKPILVVLLGAVFMLLFQIILFLIGMFWSNDPQFINSISTSYDDMDVYSGPGALVELGGIACLIPALALAALIVRDRPFSSYSSSRGGWNWKLFFKCLLIAVTIMAIELVVELAFFPSEDVDGTVLFTAAGLIVCIVFVPLQSVAEEYIFRGLLLQTVGAWTKVPFIAIAVSAIVFAAGHPYNTIGVVTIFINGLIWGFIVWKSKGLEATSALHIVNNMIAFITGGFGLSTVTSEVPIESLVIALVIDVVYAACILLLGKKFGWFASQGDDVGPFNYKKREKIARKNARKQQQMC